jgi:ubiquinone/menaquinone biosynthesis C-methylase UbiE/uncharacterized protein YbaR (Trm112 family)
MMLAERQSIDESFLAALACPGCKGRLVMPGPDTLRCEDCGAEYEVAEGIPILVVERPESQKQLHGQREIFDPQFEGYETYRLENWRQSYLTRLRDALRLAPTNDGWYADVGAGGSGYTVIEAARLGYRAIGCDLSWEGMRKAASFARSQNLAERAKFVVCSAEALPLRSARFDAVCSIAVLEHLVRDDLAVAELARVLRPGGRAFVTVPHTFFRTNLIFWLPYWLHDRAHGHLRHYTARRLSRLFAGEFTELQPFFTGRTAKVVQILAERFGIGGDELWWKLERLDLRNIQSPWGGQLHLAATRRT